MRLHLYSAVVFLLFGSLSQAATSRRRPSTGSRTSIGSRTPSRTSSGSGTFGSSSLDSGSTGSKTIGSKTPGLGTSGSRTLGSGSTGSKATGSKPIGPGTSGSQIIGAPVQPAHPGVPGGIHRNPDDTDDVRLGAGVGIVGTGIGIGGISGSGRRRPEVFVGTGRRICHTRSDCPKSVRGLSGMCHHGTCSCLSWYIQTDQGCVENDGRRCATKMECEVTVGNGGTGECEGRKCVCLSGYLPTPGGCQELTSTGGSTSVGTRHRSPSHYADPGKYCLFDPDCPSTSRAYTGRCVSSSCQCSSSYFKKGRSCTDGASSIKASSILVAMAMVIFAFLAASK